MRFDGTAFMLIMTWVALAWFTICLHRASRQFEARVKWLGLVAGARIRSGNHSEIHWPRFTFLIFMRGVVRLFFGCKTV